MKFTTITQGHVNRFYQGLRERKASLSGVSMSEYACQVVQAAAEAGWYPGLRAAEVENMDPRQVIQMAGEINGYLDSITRIDPNSSGPLSNTPETTDNPAPMK